LKYFSLASANEESSSTNNIDSKFERSDKKSDNPRKREFAFAQPEISAGTV